MRQNTKIFEGLFDRFGDKPEAYDDVLIPIKRELERFLVSRQKSKGTNVTCLASDYGMPTIVWEKGDTDFRSLEQIVTERIQQLDPRCHNVKCHIDYKDSEIILSVALNVTPPWQREPIEFAIDMAIAS
jgi:predicted component of type VI protein secretion system